MSQRDLPAPPRFVVGIDLGTTNSAVCFVDTERQPREIETFAVPQVVEAGVVDRRETLPSFHYEAAASEFGPGALRCAWHGAEQNCMVGAFARDHGAKVPARLVVSAKSWLCHSGVDRTAAILPWQGADDLERLSPIETSARYLEHIRLAWDHDHPDHPLAQQDVVLTLPASFDEVARELTVKAARRAGLPRVVLIEEPQAAFYAWIDRHRDDWDRQVLPGQKILVCDIGGGTSDFTLIRVRRGEGGKVQFHRVAVGDHLILGGDNFDLALARHLEARLADGGKLAPGQWAVLVRACRQAKETLLGENPPERITVHLPGRSARLIGGGMQVEVTRDEARALLLEGFMPQLPLSQRPQSRVSGFQEFGLPYAPDAAITRYLGAFLDAHRHAGAEEHEQEQVTDYDPARPDLVLFNGAVFNSPDLRDRLLAAISGWFAGSAGDWRPVVLRNDRLDLAVARGAAYFGMVRRGEGVRIAAGLARTYYVGVDGTNPAAAQALCLVPAGVEPGQQVELQREFHLLVDQPVEFPLYVSSTRLTDKPGELVPFDPEKLIALPPIRTVLKTRGRGDAESIGVHLNAGLSELGTLELWCSEPGTRNRWRLEFDVRVATQTDAVAHAGLAEREGMVDEDTWQACRQAIEDTFGSGGGEKPQQLIRRLGDAIGSAREQWPASLLRRIWESLVEYETGRSLGPVHEARWLNLLGFSLRPGYGLAVDDWRVAETWRLVQGRLLHASPQIRNEGWILWRRIAGGLSAGQQQAVAEPLIGAVRAMHRQATTGKGRGGDLGLRPQETAELWRLLGSLELLPVEVKRASGQMLVDLLPKRKFEPVREPLAWALGRIGARQPLYGPLNCVVPTDVASVWLKAVLADRDPTPSARLAAMELARKTDDRYRDLSERLRRETADWLSGAGAPAHFIRLVEHGGQLDRDEQDMVFGESLPRGLRLEEGPTNG
ncbi:MAG: Hsp70 family protein [Patescibacteria group bacterium]|nr:Hsp70 family protein [Patescibacteria group bacterium]